MMEVLKKVKRKLSVVLAAAMVVTSITIPNATVVKAAGTPAIKDVIQSVAGYNFWDAKSNTIVLDRKDLSITSDIDITVKSGSYTVSVNEAKFVSNNDVDTKRVLTKLRTEDFSEQTDEFNVTVTDEKGDLVSDGKLTVLLKAKKVEVDKLKYTTPEAGTISVTGEIVSYENYKGIKPTVKYQIDNNNAKEASVSDNGVFSFKESGLTSGNHDVSFEIHSSDSSYSDPTAIEPLKVSVPGKQEEVPYINVNFQSVDRKEIYEDGSTVPFNDINVVVSANNVPEGAKVTLEVPKWSASTGEAVQYLIKKELVVSGKKVDATEPIKMPEDAFGKTIYATVKIEDAKGTILANNSKSVFVKNLKVKYKVVPTGAFDEYDINGVVKLDYDEQYEFIVEYGGNEVAITKAVPLYSENSYMTVSGNYAYFKSLAKDAGKNFSYKVSAKIEGKEVVIGNINIELMRNYTITINGDKKKFTVSGNKAEQNKYQYEYKEGTEITYGDLEIIANKGYRLSEVKINGYNDIYYSVERHPIYLSMDENYVIDVTTVAVDPKKADVLFSINGEKELKSNATINCGDFICGTAFKNGVNISTSANIILKEKKGSKYEKVSGADLTAYGFEYWSDGDYGQIEWPVLNAASGKQFQIVVQDENHTYATYNLKVSKIAEKILVDKKAEKEFKVEAGKEITVNLSGDGYVQRYDVSENAVLYPDKVEFESGDNGKGTFYVYPGAEGEYKFKLYGFVNGYQSVSPAAVTIKVEKPAWVDKDVVVSRSDKYTSYENLGFVASLKEKNKYKMKAGDEFKVGEKKYTYKWEYTVSGNKVNDLATTDEVDLGVRPSGTEVTAKLVLVDENDHVVYQSKVSEKATLNLRDNLKTEKIGFKKKSSAAYTNHAVELATLTYDKNTGRTLSDYYNVRLYDQNGDIIIESGNKAYDKLAVWLEDGSLVVYAPRGTEGKKFTAEVYADAGKDSKDADVVAKTTFTVKKSIESIKDDTINVFKKENKALKVSLKPVFNVGDKAPASKKVSYAFDEEEYRVPDGVTLKGNTITIAKDARFRNDTPIKVTVTAEDVKDKNKKITGTITVNVKTSASNAAAVYVAESLGNAYKPVNKLVAGKEYSVILAKETNQDILYEKDLVDAFTYTTDKSITKNAFTITPTVAKKNVKITATAYDGVKKTTKVDVVNKELEKNYELSIKFDDSVSTNTISIDTTSADLHNFEVLLNGKSFVPSEYGLTTKVSGLKYNKDFGGYVMTGETASIKVKGKDVEGKNVDKTFTIENKQYKALKKAKAPSLKADKKFTVITATNSTNADSSLNVVTITNKNYVSANQVKAVVAYADQKTEKTYKDVKSIVVRKHSLGKNDGSFVLNLGKRELPAGNMKLNVYYVDAKGIPVTNAKAITIPVQKMKYSFKLSSGIKFAAGSTSVNLVAKYDDKNVAKVEYTGEGLGAQNAFKKGTGKYNAFAEFFKAVGFDKDKKTLALTLNGKTAEELGDMLSSKDKDTKANKNGVIKVKVTYKDGAVRYYTTKVTVSQAKPKK